MTSHLDTIVAEAAQNAWENEYRSWLSVEALALDMVSCDADLESEAVDDIVESLTRLKVLEEGPQGTKVIRKFWED